MFGSFFQRYFLEPMGHYYTLPATIAYALVFVLAVFVVYRYVLKKAPVKIDSMLLYSLVPFVALGGLTRVLRDAGFYGGYLFVSPVIYMTLFFITLGCFSASILLHKFLRGKWKRPYHIWMVLFGTLLCVYSLYQIFRIGIVNYTAGLTILGLTGAWAVVLYPVTRFLPQYLSRLNYMILLTHLLDGSATFVSTSFYGYFEQHVLPRFLFELTGPWIMFPLKIGVVWTALYATDRLVEEEELRVWIKIAVLILGLALGIRDLFRVCMMV